MNLKNIALATILGITTPVISLVSFSPIAIAQLAYPVGNFKNEEWSISLWYENNVYHYYTLNLNSGQSISLSGARLDAISTQDRYVYLWRNGDFEYKIAWQPEDPDFIRLIVVNPNNQVIVNSVARRNDTY